jgi:3-dehydroquinate synthase
VRSYSIELHHGAIAELPRWLADLATSKCVLIYDANVERHAQELLKRHPMVALKVMPGEEQKSLSALSMLYDGLAAAKADRQTLVLAMGGGVIGDLAGFAAASFNRGLPLVMIPTTLLAMVDSSVGGKVGINHPAGKNLIGAFHQPRGVWVDTHYLSTLPDREFRSGLAEVVKYGIILDAIFFQWLEQHTDAILNKDQAALAHIITRSCQLKAQVVEQDEFETTGIRALLNFGHTLGHAVEKVTGYGYLLHGEAVAIGMVFACRLAERLGMINNNITRRVSHLLHLFHLPTEVDPNLSPTKLVAAMQHDKKNVAGQLRFVLPTDIGIVKSGIVVEQTIVANLLQQKAH